MTKADEMRQSRGVMVKEEARSHFLAGYSHFLLRIETDDTYMIQAVESVGWVLEHAGWVGAEKGYVGYGGFGVLNSAMVGNYLFRRPRKKAREELSQTPAVPPPA
jgi:hypothetical protein